MIHVEDGGLDFYGVPSPSLSTHQPSVYHRNPHLPIGSLSSVPRLCRWEGGPKGSVFEGPLSQGIWALRHPDWSNTVERSTVQVRGYGRVVGPFGGCVVEGPRQSS